MPARDRRAPLPRTSDHTRQFVKDWERLSRSGRYDMLALRTVMLALIANDGPLGAEYMDHPLKGKLSDCRECHIGGDFLLIYQTDERRIVFVRAGTHADLFSE